MSQFILNGQSLIDAAIVDIDARKAAGDARSDFAQKHGAVGHKVVMSAQDGPQGLPAMQSASGVEISAVTLLRFDRKSPVDFVTVGQDKDGSVLALPDMRTARGNAIAQEMGNLPAYSTHLSNALGFSPKIKDGRVSFGIVSVEEVGRHIVVNTNQSPSKALDAEPISPADYASLRQGAERARKIVSEAAPSPFSR